MERLAVTEGNRYNKCICTPSAYFVVQVVQQVIENMTQQIYRHRISYVEKCSRDLPCC